MPSSRGAKKPSKQDKANRLMIADSDHDADMLYATGLFVPDPFIYARIRGRPMVVMSDLEIDRAQRSASHLEVLSLTELSKNLPLPAGRRVELSDVAARLACQHRIRRFEVPTQFPLGIARALERYGVRCEPVKGPFFPEREFKSPKEIRQIQAALRITEAGLQAGIDAIRAAKIQPKTQGLRLGGAPLTSQGVRAIIDAEIVRRGGLPNNTIVAGGNQACDPHERGEGPLKANTPIILDVFPRSQRSGYFGDMTRTVLRGKASDAAKRLFAAVQQSQRVAIRQMQAGTRAITVHNAVANTFDDLGFQSGRIKDRFQGFFHGTGHGLGLEIHELPRVGKNTDSILAPGQVITVEPGLYYPGIGGCRLEDVVVITESSARKISRFPQVFELPSK